MRIHQHDLGWLVEGFQTADHRQQGQAFDCPTGLAVSGGQNGLAVFVTKLEPPLNAALAGWAEERYGGFNHQFYEQIFELMLRLRANYLWPAMWGRAFYDDCATEFNSTIAKVPHAWVPSWGGVGVR